MSVQNNRDFGPLVSSAEQASVREETPPTNRAKGEPAKHIDPDALRELQTQAAQALTAKPVHIAKQKVPPATDADCQSSKATAKNTTMMTRKLLKEGSQDKQAKSKTTLTTEQKTLHGRLMGNLVENSRFLKIVKQRQPDLVPISDPGKILPKSSNELKALAVSKVIENMQISILPENEKINEEQGSVSIDNLILSYKGLKISSQDLLSGVEKAITENLAKTNLSDPTQASKAKTQTLKMLHFCMKWVTSEHFLTDSEDKDIKHILKKIVETATSSQDRDIKSSGIKLKEKLEILGSGIKTFSHSKASIPAQPKEETLPDMLDFIKSTTPEKAAKELDQIFVDAFAKVPTHEWLANPLEAGAPSAKSMTNLFNKTSLFIARSIFELGREDLDVIKIGQKSLSSKEKKANLKTTLSNFGKVINMAKHLKDLGNYPAFISIGFAFINSSIERLVPELNKKMQKEYHSLMQLMSLDKNYKNLKEAEQSLASNPRATYVPFFGNAQKQVESFGNVPNIQEESKTLNISKMNVLSNKVLRPLEEAKKRLLVSKRLEEPQTQLREAILQEPNGLSSSTKEGFALFAYSKVLLPPAKK